MPIRSYCRIPEKIKTPIRKPEGSCPQLLTDLMGELEGATEIHIAAYLFNNPIYARFLVSLAEAGCKVVVTSLPLNGYSPKKLLVEGIKYKISGRDMAVETYGIISTTNSIRLRIFPHMYIWYGALYADGGASFSFHIKAIMATYGDGRSKCMLSSGNFMFTDPSHSENLIVFENEPLYQRPFKRFFSDLENYSIPIEEFDRKFPTPKDKFLYCFPENCIEIPNTEYQYAFFTSPFYATQSGNSNSQASKRIRGLIQSSRKRIWICAQHFHDLMSYDQNAITILSEIFALYQQNPFIDLRALKQVPHSSLADKRRAGIAETLFQFQIKKPMRYNRLVHDKFMILDDMIIVTTANFTPTQFAFGRRKMKMTIDQENVTKEDNFSEVNGFIVLENPPADILSDYEKHFLLLWESGEEALITL